MSFVATNLVHQQLWTEVSDFEREGYQFCTGVPAEKLHPDDPSPPRPETVLITRTKGKWSVAEWSKVFKLVDCDRIVMAMVTEDSAVVYYLVYKGLQVPRKN